MPMVCKLIFDLLVPIATSAVYFSSSGIAVVEPNGKSQ
jgi:hypothetical protein